MRGNSAHAPRSWFDTLTMSESIITRAASSHVGSRSHARVVRSPASRARSTRRRSPFPAHRPTHPTIAWRHAAVPAGVIAHAHQVRNRAGDGAHHRQPSRERSATTRARHVSDNVGRHERRPRCRKAPRWPHASNSPDELDHDRRDADRRQHRSQARRRCRDAVPRCRRRSARQRRSVEPRAARGTSMLVHPFQD